MEISKIIRFCKFTLIIIIGGVAMTNGITPSGQIPPGKNKVFMEATATTTKKKFTTETASEKLKKSLAGVLFDANKEKGPFRLDPVKEEIPKLDTSICRTYEEFLKLFSKPDNYKAFVERNDNTEFIRSAYELKDFFRSYRNNFKDFNEFMEFALLLHGEKPSYLTNSPFPGFPEDKRIQFYSKNKEMFERLGIKVCSYDKFGDGNLSIVFYRPKEIEKIIEANKDFYSQFGDNIEEIIINANLKNQQGQLLGYGTAYTDDSSIVQEDKIRSVRFSFKGTTRKHPKEQTILGFCAYPEDIEYLSKKYKAAIENITGCEVVVETFSNTEFRKMCEDAK